MSTACNPCPFVSGAFGLVPKDDAKTSFQAHKLLAQKANVCQLEVCDPEIGDVKGNSTYLQLNEDQVILGTGIQQTVIFDKVVRSGLPGYDTTTGIFTAPVKGNYAFTLQLVWTALTNSGAKTAYIRFDPLNSVGVKQFATLLDQEFEFSMTLRAVVFLDAGEQMAFQALSAQIGTFLIAMTAEGQFTQAEIVLLEQGLS